MSDQEKNVSANSPAESKRSDSGGHLSDFPRLSQNWWEMTQSLLVLESH